MELLVALTGLHWASLWALDAAAEVRCVCTAGEEHPSRRAKGLATRLLAGERLEGERRVLLGVALGSHERPRAVLVARAGAGERERCRAMLATGAPILCALVQRDLGEAQRVSQERAQLESSERRLARLDFDLHDGPIQDVAALAQDLHLFVEQLEAVLGASPRRELLRGRTEDLAAQLVSLEAGLRRICGEARSGRAAPRRHFRAALAERVQSFAERTGIQPRVRIAGPLTALSDSQQIALLSIVTEALTNVRRHAAARAVEIAVKASRHGVGATITDDGRGFDAAARPKRAARQGRKGLLAISERVRLLGGQCVIESKPGGPTVVRVAFERWPSAVPVVRSRRARQAAAPAAGGKGASRFSNA
jgi:signal transduction histidine kinase